MWVAHARNWYTYCPQSLWHSTQFIEHDSSHRASPYYALLSICLCCLTNIISLYRFSAHYRSCSLWHATNMKAGYALHMSKTISCVYQFPFTVYSYTSIVTTRARVVTKGMKAFFIIGVYLCTALGKCDIHDEHSHLWISFYYRVDRDKWCCFAHMSSSVLFIEAFVQLLLCSNAWSPVGMDGVYFQWIRVGSH